MKKTVLALAALAMLVTGSQAPAVIGTVDAVPAATLLLPYFEVDSVNPLGVTTLMSVNNASATAILAHVTVWTDMSVPVLDFSIYLTGYDVQTINLRDVLVLGNLPRTASAGQDPTNTISPKGIYSQDINFASCSGILPYAPLPANYLTHLANALTGKASSFFTAPNNCSGFRYGDAIMRGYVTVDTVNACQVLFPSSTGYFVAGGGGIATVQNVLWGDYFYVDQTNNFAQGDTLVHIEASATNPQTSVPGEYTFYGRYVNWTAADNREPLVSEFATRYISGGVFTGGTSIVAYRDAKQIVNPFSCTSYPAWYPLPQEQIVIFDETEQPTLPPVCTVSPCVSTPGSNPFPIEAQRTRVGSTALAPPFNFGWLFLDLNGSVVGAAAVPPEDPLSMQNWITTIMDASGRFSVGFSAIQLDNATDSSHATIP